MGIVMKNEAVKRECDQAVGLVFLVFGIMPSFARSFGTLILLQKLMGGTVEPTLIARTIIVMGIMVGIACAAAVCLVVGGLLGTVMGYIVSAPAAMREWKAAAENA
jgi:hypothetical protein